MLQVAVQCSKVVQAQGRVSQIGFCFGTVGDYSSSSLPYTSPIIAEAEAVRELDGTAGSGTPPMSTAHLSDSQYLSGTANQPG